MNIGYKPKIGMMLEKGFYLSIYGGSSAWDPQSRLWLCGAPKFGDVTCDQVLVQENGNIALNFAECIACTDT